AGGNPDGRNKTVISNLNIKFTHIFENETKAYNAKKKFPMTQKELKVKEFSTPGQVKIKKVKIDVKNEQVTITWDPVKKAEGYEVYIAKWRYREVGNKYGEYELEKDITSANATEYLDKYLYKGTTYFYKVRAYYKVNGVKVYGPFSEVKEAPLNEE
ncbi:MAG: fibronectin type III domain-containing protein, partial [Lachnospiraceae bacterium]|nr:fibronectin type III domain-containing protein [Lachnospiraceae bacterium]